MNVVILSGTIIKDIKLRQNPDTGCMECHFYLLTKDKTVGYQEHALVLDTDTSKFYSTAHLGDRMDLFGSARRGHTLVKEFELYQGVEGPLVYRVKKNAFLEFFSPNTKQE